MNYYCPHCDELMAKIGQASYGGFIAIKLRCPDCGYVKEISDVD